MPPKKSKTKMSDRIRAEIEQCEVRKSVIARATGINEAALSRFMSGQRGLSMEALDALFEYFDLDVVTKRRKRS